MPDPFTARPASRQITLAEAAADAYVDAFRQDPAPRRAPRRSARGWTGSVAGGGRGTTATRSSEYWAVREGVSIGDVSTLGKLVVSGPDVVELLERLYPCHVADIKPGRSRYALLLNERGHVMDDGMILRESETRFVLSFTSGGAANAEMWVRDWIDVWGLRVHVLDRTMSLAAINVTGPLAGALLRRAGLADPPRFLGHVRADVAGVPCHVMRLSFTGEAAFELHHPVDRSVELWRALLDLGADLGIRPHGLQALFGLRLEKGHVIVGMDTELDTTPRRLGMDWAVRMEKPRFIGRASLERTAKLADHRRWVGFTMDGPAPVEGAPIWSGGEVVGNVTGSWHSPLLGKALMLGWLRRTPFPTEVEIDGRDGRRDADPVLRPGGPSCPRLSRCTGCASSPIRRRSTPRAGRATTSRSSASRPTTPSPSAPTASRSTTSTPSSNRRPGSPAPGSRSTPSPTTSSGRSRPSARRSPRAPSRSVPAKRLAARRRRRAPHHRRRLRRRAREPPPMSAYTDTLPPIRWPDGPPKASYDVVIVGGGGHGLSTAYYLATRHGITNVAVLEADYIASGNTGRNTTIIRANYGIPEAIRFYQHSLELYQGLEAETGAEILHQTKGIFWVAHTEMAMRTERARGPDEHGLRREDRHGHARPSSRSSSRRST